MKTDAQIQEDVIRQLKWNPLLMAADIGVSVQRGVVTLSGQVDTYFKKSEAEKEARKVTGVRAIAENIHVGISPKNKRTDTEIAEAVLHALKWDTSIPEENIKVKVERGVVTLDGSVEWDFQRAAAGKAVAKLASVQEVLNRITLKPKITPSDLKQKIQAAFLRDATIDASRVQVEVLGSKVTLRGQVRSLAEKEEAEKAAWAAPGIVFVENMLEVEQVPEHDQESL